MTIDTTRLRALAEAARPGPWAWYGNTRMTDVYLATVRGGRNYVMDFVRWGMRGAQPRFNVGGIMRTTKELAAGECFAIDHPDAAFIAAMDPTTILALLDEVERLNDALGLAYPRALQAAADVVDRETRVVTDVVLNDIANDILDLTEEQIEAFDAKVERDHAEAVAPKPERPVVIWHWRDDEEELPACDDVDEAVYNAIHAAGWGMCGKLERPGMLEETVTVYGFARMAPTVLAWRYLEQALEDLDEEHSDGSATKPTPAMIEAADAFASAIEREYVSWACEVVEKRVVNVREWCAAHRPEWLAQLPAIESEEGGDHG